MTRSNRHSVAAAGVALIAIAMSACDRKPSSPPPRQYTAQDAAADAAAAQRMRQSRRIPRDGGDSTIAFSRELEPFLGVWYDEASGLDAITIDRVGEGNARVMMHGDDSLVMAVDRVRWEAGHVRFDVGAYWVAGGPNPMAGAEGLPMQYVLTIGADDPDTLAIRISSEILDREAGTQRLRRRSRGGGE